MRKVANMPTETKDPVETLEREVGELRFEFKGLAVRYLVLGMWFKILSFVVVILVIAGALGLSALLSTKAQVQDLEEVIDTIDPERLLR